jgi:hypothetical protein
MSRIKSSEKKAYIEQIVAWNKEGVSQYERERDSVGRLL